MFDQGFSPEKFLNGLVTAVGISWFAYRAKALDPGGAVAAAILGTVVFSLGGVGWAVVMLTFFISSSALSRFFKRKKESQLHNFSKGSQRDAWQVAANGGAAGFLALLFFVVSAFFTNLRIQSYLWLGFASSLAGANADTWGTELGFFNPTQPTKINTFKKVPKGTSGAISMVGSLAALVGSALIGGVAVLSISEGWGPINSIGLGLQFLIINISGLVGALIDSIMGATIQSVYYCPNCKKETEQSPFHSCGTRTVHKRGLPWLNNDWVNAACTISAGITGILLAVLLN